MKIKAWSFSCELKKIFFWDSEALCIDEYQTPLQTRRKAIAQGNCLCGNKCKPIKIEIEVREMK